jgi:hypothetical protein
MEAPMGEHDPETPLTPDVIVARAPELMIETGSTAPQVVDRFLTYGAAQAVHMEGSAAAAAAFRAMADRIEGGVFDHLASHATTRH